MDTPDPRETDPTAPDARHDVARILKAARHEMHLSQRDVERESGVSNSYLSQIEQASVPVPTADVLIKLARACQVDPVALLITSGHLTAPQSLPPQLPDFIIHAAHPLTTADWQALHPIILRLARR